MRGARAHVGPSKTAVPSAGSTLLARPRLTDRLDALVASPGPPSLMVVCAPAGFGKTTLLSSWASGAATAERPVAWCTLDESDSSCFRVWSALLVAMARASALLAPRLEALSAPRGAGDGDFLADLDVILTGSCLVLVVENLHELEDPGALSDLNLFLGHPPPSVVVVVSSRTEPPLSAIQSAKVTGRIVRVVSGDLAFRRDEVAALFPDLTSSDVETIWSWTEGWPALVRLMEAGLGSSARGTLPPVLDDGDLADYLFDAAFLRHDERTRRILMLSAVPDVVPTELAVLVAEDAEAPRVLEEAAQDTGLVTRIPEVHGGAGYRMHPLLRSYLCERLRRLDPGGGARAQQVTALWCLEAGQHLAAVRHASRSRQDAVREHVVREVGPGLINAGESELLLDALARPETEDGGEQTWTRLVRSAALLDLGRLSEAAAEFYGLHSGTDSPSDDSSELEAAWHAVDVHLRRLQGQAVDDSRLRIPVTTRDPDLRLLVAIQRSSTLLRQGAPHDAATELDLGLELARGLGRMAAVIDCLTIRSAVHGARSEHLPMACDAEEALLVAEQHGWAASSRMAHAHMLRAWAHYQSLADGLALWHAERARSLLTAGSEPTVRVSVMALDAVLAPVRGVAAGDRAEPVHRLVLESEARQIGPVALVHAGFVDAHQSFGALRVDRITETARILRDRLGAVAEVDVVTALGEWAAGRLDTARSMLAAVVAQGPPAVTTRLSMVEALVAAASLAHLEGDTGEARDLAQQALEVAGDVGGLRPLVDGGGPFRDVLRLHHGSWGSSASTVERVLRYRSTPDPTLTDLTSREIEILSRLSSLATAEDIATSLFVSVNTVKTHIRSVYRKLGVGSRREAVAEAGRLGLL